MNHEGYEKQLIKDFLDEVKRKLPTWLKVREEEVNEVLRELEEHLEDKIEGLMEKGEDREAATRAAIFQMGSPSTIAREYKRRGTPKFYITEELWSTYLTALKYMAIIVALIAVISTTINTIVTGLTGGVWWAVLLTGLQGMVLWMIILAAGISVLFVWLSYEGYFPEDIKKIFKPKEKTVLPETQIPKTKVEPVILPMKKERPKWLDKPHGLIVGGIFPLVIGILAVWQPITELNILIDPLFLSVLLWIGTLWIILGVLGIIHGIFVSWSYNANRTLYPMRAVISLFAIPIVVFLLVNPQIFPLFWWSESTGFQVIQIPFDFYWLYYLILALVIVGTIAGAIHGFYKTTKLEEDYFFEA